jgi:NAD(P)-dependent dehydrogenase (short-subunit alcohol dehydrogenase family)
MLAAVKDLLPTKVDLNGQRVLITGPARGIGAETARQLVKRGAKVGLVGLEPALLEKLADELGPNAVWAEADVRDLSALRWAVTQVSNLFGGLDVVVANAGIASYGTIATVDPAEFQRTVDVNLLGVFRTMHVAIPELQKTKGYFLTISSLAGLSPCPGLPAYAATKAGVESLGIALRYEGHTRGITSGVLYPSWIDTDMVRDIARDLEAFRRIRKRLPFPANSTTDVATCAAAVVKAIERRQRQIYVPGGVRLLRVLKPYMVMKPVIGLADRSGLLDDIDLLERELADSKTFTSDPLAKAANPA